MAIPRLLVTEGGILFFIIVALPIAALSGAYILGSRRSRTKSLMPHIYFGTGIALFAASVVWPFENLARDNFFVHQIGILIARIVAPMLVIFAYPAATLVRGLPRFARTRFLKPVTAARSTRLVWRWFRMPALATIIYIATLYFWELPVMQARAILSAEVGAALHLSLFACGLLFWSRVFDRRPQPHGLSHPARLMMLWLAILMQILAGATITLKSIPWYSTYALADQLDIRQQLTVEAIGGMFIWIPSSLATLVGLIIVVDMWGRYETRMDIRRTAWSPSNSAILLYPETASALRASTTQKNRNLALSMLMFVLFIVSMAVATAIAYRFS